MTTSGRYVTSPIYDPAGVVTTGYVSSQETATSNSQTNYKSTQEILATDNSTEDDIVVRILDSFGGFNLTADDFGFGKHSDTILTCKPYDGVKMNYYKSIFLFFPTPVTNRRLPQNPRPIRHFTPMLDRLPRRVDELHHWEGWCWTNHCGRPDSRTMAHKGT